MRKLQRLPKIPPITPSSKTASISTQPYCASAELTSNIIRPPCPNRPHFPVQQYSMKVLNTNATTAVVKNVLQRRALRHLTSPINKRIDTWINQQTMNDSYKKVSIESEKNYHVLMVQRAHALYHMNTLKLRQVKVKTIFKGHIYGPNCPPLPCLYSSFFSTLIL